MTPESLSPPLDSRKAMYLEFALVCGLIWIPAIYNSIGDYLGWWNPSTHNADEIFAMYSNVAFGMLPVYLFWRNGEPMRKLGLKALNGRDAAIAVVLLVLAGVIHFAFELIRSGLATQTHALTSIRLYHGFSLVIEALAYLLSAFREEIFYRAYVCSRLRDFGLNWTRIIILSALIFSSAHIYQGWGLLPFHFAFGLIFAIAFLNYRSLWPLVVAHACYNLSLLAGSR